MNPARYLLLPSILLLAFAPAAARSMRVGAAAAEIAADDSMVIEGSIGPRYVKGQEAPLRAVALVIESNITVAIISIDAIKYQRDWADKAAREVEAKTGIPFANILMSATHTHSGPATGTVHGVERDVKFCANVKDAIVAATLQARKNLQPAEMLFALGEESSVGQNSRVLLADGTIYWVGPKDDIVRPTGPFDPQLPVLEFRGRNGRPAAILFNHSSHNIGGRLNKRSPAFYGLAEQELETELGGTSLFLPGAFGSTHVWDLSTDERVLRIKNAVKQALGKAERRDVDMVRSVKKEFPYKVRTFDEQKEEQAVSFYVKKRSTVNPERTIGIFRDMRKVLAPQQGETRRTWLQVMTIGDIAFVGLPGEVFTALGVEIKRRSPFRYTYVVGQANDAVGYIPDPAGFDLGGYQVWTGMHSLLERGAGAAMVDEAVRILNQLAPACPNGGGR